MSPRNPPMNFGVWINAVKEHWALVIVLCFAAIPLFVGLDGDYLWEDEGDTAALALNIKKFGVPKAWDGVTFLDSDQGRRENDDLVMVSHPWVQYYVAAASFYIWGETPFAARFPFALSGWLTIIAAYMLSFRLLSSKRAALSTAILLALSIQFALFSRQCRNYPLAMLLTCVLLLAFLRLKDWKRVLQFSFVGILLFHTHPSAVAPLGALGLLTLIYKPFAIYRKWFWASVPLITLLTVPWFFLAREGYTENTTTIYSFPVFLARLTQFFIETASATPAVGIIILFVIVWVRHYRETRASQKKDEKFSMKKGKQLSHSLFQEGERHLMMTIGFFLCAYGVLVALTQSRFEMWQMGLRHVAAIIPLSFLFLGMLIAKLSRSSGKVWLGILLIFGVTKLGSIAPWSFLHDEESPDFNPASFASMHAPKGWANKIFRLGLISFYKDLLHDNHGTVSEICEYLKAHATPGDVLITNYAWEPLYFHTRLPQGLKILPEYPIYEVARKRGLPEYVFTVAEAKWIVWRHAWNGYQGYDWQKLTEAMRESGATLEKVATLRETVWENRENLHFRRFPGDDYKYAWYENPPPAEIYRVHWSQ